MISGWSNCIVKPSKISSLHTASEAYPAPAAACLHCWPPSGCFLREAPWLGHSTWIPQGWGELNICLTAEGEEKKKKWAKGPPSYSAKNLNSYMPTRMREDREVQVSGHCLWCKRGPLRRNLQENLWGRVRQSCWARNARWCYYKKKWKSKCCYPRGISQDCQRRFGKWRSSRWKVEKIIRAIFPTVLKARIVLAEDYKVYISQ